MKTRNMTIKAHKDAFLAAAANGLVGIVREKLEKKQCDVDCQDEKGMTALIWAATKGFSKVVEVLVAVRLICKIIKVKLLQQLLGIVFMSR